MAFTAKCPTCNAPVRLEQRDFGTKVECRECGTIFRATDETIPEDDYDRPRPPRRKRRASLEDAKGSGAATAGLVIGIFNLFCWCCPFLVFITALVGIVLSSQGLQSRNRAAAVWGIMLSVFAGCLGLFMTAFVIFAVDKADEIQKLDRRGNQPPFVKLP